METRSPRRIALAVGGLVLCLIAASGSAVRATADRSEEPVLVSGGAFPDFVGLPISDLVLYRYDGVGDEFVPIPFQIDEVIPDRVFREGTSLEFTQTIYDIYGEDDGLLDADDELAFRFGDAGAQASMTADWVAGADPERYEIEIGDTRSGAPFATRYVYLFSGSGLPVSPTSYVDWTVSATTTATTDLYEIEYQDKWLLLGYRVHSPCGSGLDLLDRFKARSGFTPKSGGTEQGFNDGSPPIDSTFMGGLSGPIRAIRYVMGAASGVNTIHHDLIYRGLWERHVNLRVHSIQQVWSYFDWLPDASASLFLPGDPSGLTVDGNAETPTGWSLCEQGNPDNPGACGDVPDWALYRSSNGGMAMLLEVPPSEFYDSADGYYLDDSAYDDDPPCSPLPTCYPDDDDAAHDFGLHIYNPSSACCNSIYTKWSTYSLCSDTGDGALGADYQEFVDHPLGVATVAEFELLGTIGTVSAELSGDDVMLSWDAVAGATSYRVYHSPFPDTPKNTWTNLGDTVATSFTHVGAGLVGDPGYYSVVGLNAGGEGSH